VDAARAVRDMEQERVQGKALAGKDSPQASFFWLVRGHDDDELEASEHIELVDDESGPFLSCKTHIVALKPVVNEQGQQGIIIYVDDQTRPMILGTFPYL
jgi:hypothetical protein